MYTLKAKQNMSYNTEHSPAKTSIRYKGLRKYLNGSKNEHNGYGYDDFVRMAGSADDVAGKSGPAKASLAKIFKVSRHTMTKWIDVYLEENE